jgi:hypothetical protein
MWKTLEAYFLNSHKEQKNTLNNFAICNFKGPVYRKNQMGNFKMAYEEQFSIFSAIFLKYALCVYGEYENVGKVLKYRISELIMEPHLKIIDPLFPHLTGLNKPKKHLTLLSL